MHYLNGSCFVATGIWKRRSGRKRRNSRAQGTGRFGFVRVHGVAEGRTWLSDFTFTFHFHALEKEMATHSSVLAWRIPGMEEPGGLPSMGSHRFRHDWSDLAAAAGAYSPRLGWLTAGCDRIDISAVTPDRLLATSAAEGAGPWQEVAFHRLLACGEV